VAGSENLYDRNEPHVLRISDLQARLNLTSAINSAGVKGTVYPSTEILVSLDSTEQCGA
jgi:hypothetical protein